MSGEVQPWQEARDRIIGLGESSARKSYYAELMKKLEELKASEADLRTLINSTHDAILILDPEGAILDTNDPMLSLFGVTREQALASRFSSFSAPGSPDRQIQEFFLNLRLGKGDQVFEWNLLRPSDGSQFESEISLRSAVIKGREVVVAVIRDISARKQAERERRQLEEQLIQARKIESIGQLAGGIAHDFNNMLTPMLSYATMVHDDLPESDPKRKDLEQVIESALRARTLVKQLLAFARKQTLAMEPMDLNRVLAATHPMLSRVLRENVSLAIFPGEGLSPLLGDVGQMEQILLNLVVNAQDAMPQGGRLTIETSMIDVETNERGLPTGRHVRLRVIDTGTGMPDDVREHLFEPFFTTKSFGTGLGLSTVYGIVKQHNGHTTVDSQLGKGTAFSLFFPPCEEAPVTKAPPPAQASPLRSSRILLVEDQAEVRASVQRILERAGHKVLSAATPDEAERLCAEQADEIQLLISDVMLDGVNGRELSLRLEEKNPRLKTLLISGYPTEALGEGAPLSGELNFLQKPFSPAELRERVSKLLA